jgi:hypothetical protein
MQCCAARVDYTGQFTLRTPAPIPSAAASGVSSSLQATGGGASGQAMGSANCLAQTNALFRKNLAIQVTRPRSTLLATQISLRVSGIWSTPFVSEIFFLRGSCF